MHGWHKAIGTMKFGSAVIAGTLAIWCGGVAQAGPGPSDGRANCTISPVRHSAGFNTSPRFLASRSSRFLATREFNVLAAPHQLAPRSSVTFIPGRIFPHHHHHHRCREHAHAAQGHVLRGPATMIEGSATGYSPKRAPICRVIRTGARP
jgi:hypothetical protein